MSSLPASFSDYNLQSVPTTSISSYPASQSQSLPSRLKPNQRSVCRQHRPPSCVPPLQLNLHKKKIQQICTKLKSSFLESEKYENDMHIQMAYQIKKCDHIQDQLTKEKNKTEQLINKIYQYEHSDYNSQTSSSDDPVFDNSNEMMMRDRDTTATTNCCYIDLKNTFGTVSPALMQYRFDELTLSYKRCQKRMRSKEKRLKHMHLENVIVNSQFMELLDKYRRLHEILEQVCCKYIKLFNRKEEEIIRLKESVQSAAETIYYMKHNNKDPAEILSEKIKGF